MLLIKDIGSKFARWAVLAVLFSVVMESHGFGQTLPAGTALPVEFLQSSVAGKAKVGDPVRARTLETITLPSGQVLPKGSVLSGQIVESRSFVFDSSPYAEQVPSVLAIRFDPVLAGNRTQGFTVRALADTDEAYRSSSPDYLDGTDPTPTIHLIGGDEFSPVGKVVNSAQDEVVGYNRKDGVHARLLDNIYVSPHSRIHCHAGREEQSMGIFSANACGLYGYDRSSYLENLTGTEQGDFRLASRRYSVEIRKGSAALLEAK